MDMMLCDKGKKQQQQQQPGTVTNSRVKSTLNSSKISDICFFIGRRIKKIIMVMLVRFSHKLINNYCNYNSLVV